MIWSSDDLGAIKVINFEAEPMGWDTRINILQIRDEKRISTGFLIGIEELQIKLLILFVILP